MSESETVSASSSAPVDTSDDAILAFLETKSEGKEVPAPVDFGDGDKAAPASEPEATGDTEAAKPDESANEEPKEAVEPSEEAQQQLAAYQEAYAATVKEATEWQGVASEALFEVQNLRSENEALRNLLEQAGFERDPNAMRVRELETQMQREQHAKTFEEHSKKVTQERMQQIQVQAETQRLMTEAQGLIAKYPELDPKKDPENATVFWRALMQPGGAKDMTKAASAFVSNIRAAQVASAAQTASKKPAPAVMRGGATSAPKRFTTSDGDIEAWLQSRGHLQP